MKDFISGYSIAIKNNGEKERAEMLSQIVRSRLGIDIPTEKYDKDKMQIIVFDSDFELSLSAPQYGFCVRKDKIILGVGAFVNFETVCDAFVLSEKAEDKIFTATEKYFAPQKHTLKALDAKSDEMIKKVLSTENTDISGIDGTVYYISEKSGDDSNDGKSSESAWKSAERMQNVELKYGDAVLFERGGLYRVRTKLCDGVTYGSYGEGEKPIICGSERDYSKGDLWERLDGEKHIWKLSTSLVDPGIIVYNAHTRDVSSYGETTGTRILDTEAESGFEALKRAEDLSFYWGTPETTHETFNQYAEGYSLFIKSVKDPNTDFCDIEIGEDIPIFAVGSGKGIKINNLCFKFGGGHAVSGAVNVTDLTVTDCVFCWIGGSLLWKDTRYGNAIEIFGACDGYVTRNNWIYEIYDTGITFQYHWKEGEAHMNNITISDNIIERSYWLLEWWLSPDVKGLPCSSENILIENNFLKFGFKSWGTVQHGIHIDDFGRMVSWGAGIASGSLGDSVKNVIIRNNIMDRSFVDGYDNLMTRLLNYYSGGSTASVEWTDNIFIQLDNQFFGRISTDEGSEFYMADEESIEKALSKIPHINGSKVCVIKTDN